MSTASVSPGGDGDVQRLAWKGEFTTESTEATLARDLHRFSRMILNQDENTEYPGESGLIQG